MKKITIKIVSLGLALVMLVGCFSSCAALGEPLLELGKTEISENVYMLFLSRLKGTLASAANYGTEAEKDSFWDMVVTTDGKTRDEYYKEQILEECKFYIAALDLFDELELELPKSYMEEIDKTLTDYVDIGADGSKSAFNSMVAAYGANYDVVREALIIEAKLAYLNDYLYGSDASKISHEVKEKYYEDNYVRFKHIFFYTYTAVYETDSDGRDIYYSDVDNRIIAYDTTALKRRDEQGNEVKDKKQQVIYETEDGKIAYDEENGQRIARYENGHIVTREFTRDELIRVSDQATLIMENLKGQERNYTLFDKYVADLTEDEGLRRDEQGNIKYPNGFYMTRDASYEAKEVLEAVCEMECGEIRKVYSEYGIHIVMKYELQENGYALSENSDFFANKDTGVLVFADKLKALLLSSQLEDSIEEVTVHSDRYSAISLKDVEPNYNY